MRKFFVAFLVVILCLLSPFMITQADAQERIYVYSSKVVFHNRGGHAMNLSTNLRLFSLFANTSHQAVYLTSVSAPYTTAFDFDDNPLLLLEAPPIPPGGNVTLSVTLKIVKQKTDPPVLSLTENGDLDDIPLDLREQYCTAEGSWLLDDIALRSLAETLWSSTGKTTQVLEIVTTLADWIGTNIRGVSHDVPYYPNTTYLEREGDCDDQSILLITLCRILGIPSYLQTGGLRKTGTEVSTYWDGHVEGQLKGIGYHGWAMIYIPPEGWLPFDMTLGWEPWNSAEGITSAPIWGVDGIKMMDVVKRDVAGDGLYLREFLTQSSITVSYKDELIIQNSDNGYAWFLQAWPIWVPILIGFSALVVLWLKPWRGFSYIIRIRLYARAFPLLFVS